MGMENGYSWSRDPPQREGGNPSFLKSRPQHVTMMMKRPEVDNRHTSGGVGWAGGLTIAVLTLVVIGFVLVVYRKGQGLPLRRRKRAKEKMRYDPIMLEQVEDSSEPTHKLQVLQYLQQVTRNRLSNLAKRFGPDFEKIKREEREIAELEYKLQKTRREIIASGDGVAIKRLVDIRGHEMVGPQWDATVGLDMENEQDDEYEWVLNDNGKTHAIHPSPAVPVLKLTK